MLADKLREIDSDVLAMLQLARRQQRDLVMLVFREESVNSMREAFDHGDTEDETKKLERAVKHFENRLQAARQKVSPAILQLIDDFLPLNPADLD
jgi:predicted enzyme involved in methoxymalonyl-ACP biosynthesis